MNDLPKCPHCGHNHKLAVDECQESDLVGIRCNSCGFTGHKAPLKHLLKTFYLSDPEGWTLFAQATGFGY